MPLITNSFLETEITAAEIAQEQAVLDLFLAVSAVDQNTALADYFKNSGRELALEAVKTELSLP